MEENDIKIKVIKIGLLGDTAVGKSAIWSSFIHQTPTEIGIITMGSTHDKTKFKLNNGNEIKLIIWDTPGVRNRRTVAISSLRAVHGLILVFNITDKSSFKNLESWLEDIKKDLDNKPIVLFGNKVDLGEKQYEVSNEEVKTFTEKYNLTYFETSASTLQGINEGFSYIVNEAYKMVEEKDKNIKIEKNISKKEDVCAGKNKKNKIK